jgi:MFS family permease
MNQERANGAAPATEAAPTRSVGWLNRNVIGAGLTSLLADACYETATSVMPAFLAALGMPAGTPAAFGVAALRVGLTEGTADAVSSSVKLGTGWWGDRFGHRKAIVVAGYAVTALATAFFALALVWPMVLAGRVVAWFGKGIRGPLRNAILAATGARSSASTAPATRSGRSSARSWGHGCSACSRRRRARTRRPPSARSSC